MRKTMFQLAIVGLSIAVGATALAAPAPRPIPAKQAEVKAALGALGVRTTSERVQTTRRGRQDLVLQTGTSFNSIVAAVKRAYRSQQRLGNGFTVAGWASLVRGSGGFTITMYQGHNRYVVHLKRRGAGTEAVVWGLERSYAGTPLPYRSAPPVRHPQVGR